MIRRARVDDAVHIWHITCESLGYDAKLSVVERQLSKLVGDPHYLTLVYVEEESDGVVAFIHAERYETLHSAAGWDVINLAVTPSRQGRGVGRCLLARFEEEARQRDGKYVRLNSRMEREGAHAFYQHVGYVGDKVQRHFVKRLDA